jgi:hypothetical protein
VRARATGSGAWVGAAAACGLLAAVAGRRRARRGAIDAGRARAVISGLEDSTVLDRRTGAVRSVQKADLAIDAAAVAEIWTPLHLERLARTYWRFLTHVTLGLIRVHYSEQERSVVLLFSPLRLLSFEAPEYQMDAARGLIRWRITRGLLVSRRGGAGRGHLQIEVRRHPAGPGRARLHIEVEVANFYPAIAAALGGRLYNATQSRLHVMITCGFLRSLARLDLAESRVARPTDAAGGDR